MNKGDKYSGLVTTLGILILVVYAKGEYGGWNIFLGCVGFTLGWKYRHFRQRSDFFFTFLVSSVLAISIVAVLFGLIGLSGSIQQNINRTPLGSSLFAFLTLCAFVSISLHFTARKTELQ